MVVSAKFAFESKVQNISFREMSNVAVCHILVALNINFNRESTLFLIYLFLKSEENANSKFLFKYNSSQNIWHKFTKLKKIEVPMESSVAVLCCFVFCCCCCCFWGGCCQIFISEGANDLSKIF